MPEIDGLQTTKLIRTHEKNTGTRKIPIIGLTANAMIEDRNQALATEMDDYITKPIQYDILKRTIETIMTDTL